MKALLKKLAPWPPDPLLSVMAAYQADTREHKVDLSIGIYRDRDGHTPVLSSVKGAEGRILKTQKTKTYEGMRGNTDFCQAIANLVFGETAAQKSSVVSYATPGGCGALSLSTQLVKSIGDGATIWVSDPTWPIHNALILSSGCSLSQYRYLDKTGFGLAFDNVMDDLSSAVPGDAVILQGICHNPTGVDFTREQWRALGILCEEKSLIPILDIAYHGFGENLENDITGVREFLNSVSIAFVAYSCSKNFALYRERAGCLLLKAPSEEEAELASQHLGAIARRSYSMPPAHGAAIVSTILQDETFRAEWLEELQSMTNHINETRKAFSKALVHQSGDKRFQAISTQKGMFSLLPLATGAAARLAKEEAIYLPASGRINIAGLAADKIENVAKLIAPYLIEQPSRKNFAQKFFSRK